MRNPIAERITDFLKHFPPFSSLTYNELLHIATYSKVLYLEKGQILFSVSEKTHDSFYVVSSGAIGLTINSDIDEILIDKCDEGDILGLRPFFANNNYLMTAKAREETIVYAIPITIFKPYVSANNEVLSFLLQSFASNTRNPLDKNHKGKLISENIIFSDNNSDIQSFQPIKYTSNPITALPSDVVRYVAQTMSSSKIGSVIIQQNNKPIGIVTDKDLSSKIATGLFTIDTSVDKIITFPVITVSQNLSIAEAQLMMLKNGVTHLCVTKDGTDNSEITGIISEHDIVVAQANNPGVLLKQCKRANRSAELKEVRQKLTDLIQHSLDKNVPLNHINSIVAEINIAITQRAIELALLKMENPPPTTFAWINIGSQGRKEQLLLTDIDNAIIYTDVDAEHRENTKSYFIQLGDHVIKILNKIGYKSCEFGMMANNELYCKSISDWIHQFNSWINTPKESNVLSNTIFFDFDFVYGDEELTNSITELIKSEIKDNAKFFAYLGADALKKPAPLGFFRQFLVENDGAHKDTFNLVSRAISPLIDAARILALSKGIVTTCNTLTRFSKLAELDKENASVYEACEDAFIEFLKFRTEEGLLNNNEGKYLNLNELTKQDKLKLKNNFQPINDIQEIIKNKFQLTYFI